MDKQKEYQVVKQMAEKYNTGAIKLTDKQKEKLARLTAKHGIEFKVKSKSVRKGLFDLADMASFGMIPNTWRPESIGQQYHGETTADKFAGGLGSLVGLGTGVGLGIKGARSLYSGLGGPGAGGRVMNYARDFGSRGGEYTTSVLTRVKEKEAIQRARNFASTMYNKGSNYIDPVPNFMNFRYPI